MLNFRKKNTNPILHPETEKNSGFSLCHLPRFFPLALIFALLLASHKPAFAIFDFTPNCQKAYEDIFWLRLEKAKKIIDNERLLAPDNRFVDYLESYHDIVALFVADSQAKYRKFRAETNNRLDRLDDDSPQSPYFYYLRTEILLHSAAAKYRFADEWSAVFDFLKAHKSFRKSKEKFSDFAPLKKHDAIFEIVFGSIPDKYKKIAKGIGFSGNLQQGIAALETHYNNTNDSPLFSAESMIFLSFAYLNFSNDNQQAFRFLQQNPRLNLKNPLIRYFYAYVAVKSGKNDLAISLLQNYRRAPNQQRLYAADFLLGKSLLYKLSPLASQPLERFVAQYPGQNHLKSAYQHLIWYYFLNQKPQKMAIYLKKIKYSGKKVLESDRRAATLFEPGFRLNPVLLKAELLFNGGYYQRALEMLQSHTSPQNYTSDRQRLEYVYRLARIHHNIGNTVQAKRYYAATIKSGAVVPVYFAPFSALQLARIYEREKNYAQAKKYYRQCLKMNQYEYQTSIEVKAKAGLNRLK